MVRPAFRLTQPLRARRLQFQQARFASTNPSTEAAQKKAQDALASAQKYAGQAVDQGKKFLGPLGERLGNLLGGACADSRSTCGTLQLMTASFALAILLLLVMYSLPSTPDIQFLCRTRVLETSLCRRTLAASDIFLYHSKRVQHDMVSCVERHVLEGFALV